MPNEPADLELVVNPSSRVVHLSTCFYAGIMQLAEPMPLEDWPEAERDQLHGCGNCNPPDWR